MFEGLVKKKKWGVGRIVMLIRNKTSNESHMTFIHHV